MLTKKNRLLSDRDFSSLFSKGRSVGGRGLGIKTATNRLGRLRVGFVVSTKVSKNAVDRNRIKRRMREIIREYLPQLNAQSIDIAIMARSEALKMSFKELSISLKQTLEKAGLIKK